ncbi:Hypothetical predicted protein, partial [Paramuricea clavata]
TILKWQAYKVHIQILSNGKGSLDYAKNLVQFGEPPPVQPSTKPAWCVCGICRPMPTEEENNRSGKIRCTTSFMTFPSACLDRDILVMAIR